MPILGTVASQFSGKPFPFLAFESIATGNGAGTATMVFSDIPQTFTHLQLRTVVRCNVSNYGFGGFTVKVGNGTADSGANYSYHRFFSSGDGSIGADGGSGFTSPYWTANNSLANNYAIGIIDILDYRNVNKYKTVRVLTGMDNNDSGATNYSNSPRAAMEYSSGNWRSNSAINIITLTVGGIGTYIETNSKFALYGIKEE